MKKSAIKRFTSLVLTFCLMLAFFSMPVFAQTAPSSDYKLETKQDAINLLDAANKGDQAALKKLRSLKAFNKDEVNKVLKGKKFTAADRIVTFKFDDGSGIEIEMGLVNQEVEKGTRELQGQV